MGLYSLRYTEIKAFFIDSPFFWHYVWALALLSLPMCLAGFYYHAFNDYIELKREPFFKILFIINSAISCFFTSCLLVDVFLRLAGSPLDILLFLSYARFFIHIVLIIDFFILLLHSIVLSLKGYNKAKIFLLGLAILVLFAANDFLAALIVDIRTNNFASLLHWGMLAVMLSLGYILVRHVRETDRRMLLMKEELHVAERIQEAVTDAPVLLLDPALRIIMANARAELLSGKKSFELKECDLAEVVAEYDRLMNLAPGLFKGKTRSAKWRSSTMCSPAFPTGKSDTRSRSRSGRSRRM